ncbi:MAG: dihydroorotate dehydrogenase-like protein [Gammaproteobacteria bacterium]|nr:dihydroorotate dehydrogenase-like protein [Gammaproteobacteria bacterium]
MDLNTRYLGLSLPSPIVVSACTLSSEPENIVQMEDCGAGAVVLFSLFEERIARETEVLNRLEESGHAFAEAMEFFPQADAYQLGSDRYLELIHAAKQRVDIPVIASLNGVSAEGWIDYAKQMQQAGADGIELNIFYLPTDIGISGVEVEQRYMRIVRRVTTAVDIPVAIKINPYFSATGWMAKHLDDLGIDGLVLFNRLYQPGIDIERLQITSDLELSEPHEIRLPLLWIAALHGRLNSSLAATSGVRDGHEVIQYLLAGADVVMSASALYKHGIEHLRTMRHQLTDWMERKQFDSIEAFRGVMSQQFMHDTTGQARANYIRILEQSKHQAD